MQTSGLHTPLNKRRILLIPKQALIINKAVQIFMSEPSQPDSSWLQTLFCRTLAGGSAGILSDVICYQLEVRKTRKQAILWGQVPAEMRSSYQGFSLNAVMAFPSYAAYFAGFSLGKSIYQRAFTKGEKPKFSLAESCFGAFVSELFCNAVRTPLEAVKTRIQAGETLSPIGTIRDIFRRSGIRGLYSGWLPLMLRDVPFSMVQFVLYDRLRASEGFFGRKDKFASFSRGMLMGICATLASHPSDVVKTLLFTQKQVEKTRILPLISLVYRREGLRGFWKGLGYRVAYVGTKMAILFLCYDELTACFERLF